MKKMMISSLATLLLCTGNIYPTSAFLLNKAYATQPSTPSYAKWGALAMKETKEKYPNAKIIDYLHIGSVKGTETSTEKFKLWLKDPQKEFGVFINIEYNNETEKVVKILFQETST